MDQAAKPLTVTLTVQQIEPLTVTVERGTELTGLSRSEIYRRLLSRDLRAVKKGRQTLIIYESLKQFINSLPPAKFGGPSLTKEKITLDNIGL